MYQEQIAELCDINSVTHVSFIKKVTGVISHVHGWSNMGLVLKFSLFIF